MKNFTFVLGLNGNYCNPKRDEELMSLLRLLNMSGRKLSPCFWGSKSVVIVGRNEDERDLERTRELLRKRVRH